MNIPGNPAIRLVHSNNQLEMKHSSCESDYEVDSVCILGFGFKEGHGGGGGGGGGGLGLGWV